MTDILKYRIPGGKTVQMKGVFSEVQKGDEPVGFIVSDFRGNNLFHFEGMETEDLSALDLHFTSEGPFCSSKEEYLSDASRFLRSIQEQNIGKAVLSRIKRVDFDEKKAFDLFDQLASNYPQALVYLISSPLFGTWIGATPEVLLKVEGRKGYTVSLAGTLPAEGEERWTEKEEIEQQLVTDFIMDTLEEVGFEHPVLNGPNEFVAGPVKHLKTDICFEFNGQESLGLAMELHPTPAVSGLPRDKALELIGLLEKHDRSLYTGMIGLFLPGMTQLFVNLRCCSIKKGGAFLYLGGGFTANSDIEKEWLETENKSKTLQNVIQQLMTDE